MSKKIDVHHAPIVFVGFGIAADITIHVMEAHGLLVDGMIILDTHMEPTVHKTLCFWSTTEQKIYKTFQQCVEHSWSKAHTDDYPSQYLNGLHYHQMSAHSLRSSTKRILRAYNVRFYKDLVRSIQSNGSHTMVRCTSNEFSGDLIFDSRPLRPKGDVLVQSFVGYHITVETPISNTESVCLMDFEIPQDGYTQFMYVLPYDRHTALCECTRFGTDVMHEDLAYRRVQEYVRTKYGKAKIVKKEQGVIPMYMMTPPPTENHVFNIGGRAGAIKPSTGYAVQFMFEHAQKICTRRTYESRIQLRKKRYRFYDALLISILSKTPHLGPYIFRELFLKTPMHMVFQFLAEKTTLATEARIFLRLPIPPFLKAASNHILHSIPELRHVVGLLCAVALYTIAPSILVPILIATIGAGMILIGIPHGALDHKVMNQPIYSISFLSSYVGLMGLVAFGWYFAPSHALLVFIIGSAWHFGETECIDVGVKDANLQLIYGFVILSSLIMPHYVEAGNILAYLDIEVPILHAQVSNSIYGFFAVVGLLITGYKKNIRMLFSLVFLLLLSTLPLMLGFFLFFIFRHSSQAWSHLRASNQRSHKEMFLHALPFSTGAWTMMSIWLYIWPLEQIASWFFVFLSCVTIPHILCMTYGYKRSIVQKPKVRSPIVSTKRAQKRRAVHG